MDESRPIFIQIAEQVENDIIDGSLPEGSQIPSTNEFAAFLRVNPATALKGVLVYRRRLSHGNESGYGLATRPRWAHKEQSL